MPIIGITRDAVYVWLRHPWWPWPWNLIFSKRNDQTVRIKHEVILTNTFPCSSVLTVRLYPPFLCYSLSTKPQFLTHELFNFHHIFETKIRLKNWTERLVSKFNYNENWNNTLVFVINASSIRSKVSIRANPKWMFNIPEDSLTSDW